MEKIGDVLVRIGAMTAEQVEEVLRTQEAGEVDIDDKPEEPRPGITE